ncbi:MAG TPA: AAA family ATPase [Acidimicrobiales bacterium]|nr:AAA family ATPase [Acidimicrobiales bacterium]
MRLEVTLIGDITLGVESEETRRTLAGGNARVTLALLTLERAQGVTSERLAEVLWPDGLPATWRSALRMTMSRVRSFLKDALGPTAPDPLVAQDGRYRWQLPDGVSLHVDVEDGDRLLAAAREALASGDHAAARRDATRAADRLRGTFLAGRHGPWVDEQRDRQSDLLVAALEVASRAAAAEGDAAAALALADDAVERAPLRESAHRARMGAHAAAGNRGEALLAYQRLRRVLADQLGVDPDAETEEAYLQLLGPAAPARPARAGVGAGAGDAPDAGGGVASPAPFVGRDAELAVLDAAWDRAAIGARHVVVVTGEAGIGKTRLATEAARRVSALGGLVLFGRCDQEAIVPYQPIVEALDGYVAATPADELPAMDEAARAELAAVLPSLDGPLSGRGGPDGRARLFDAVTALVASAAADRAVLLVLDDLQWADDDTLLLVRHLLRRAGDAPVLVVAVSRDHDVVPGSVLGDVIHALDRDGWVRRLPLGGLDEADVRALVRRAVATPSDQVALTRRLMAETAGNPFLVTEMLRTPLDEGDAPIPLGVQELVAGRLGRLGVAATELLRAAAVAGSRFELDLVAAAAGLDEDATLDGLDVALASGLVAEESAETYRFPHDIVRRTLVAQLSGARRRALHARLAEAIEALRSDRLAAYTAVLAHHTAATAGPRGDQRAVRWSRAAAAQANAHRALVEAVRLERQALSHVPRDDGGQRAEVLLELAMALLAAGDAGAESTLIDAAAVARQHGRLDVLARVALALADRAEERPELRTDATALVDAALASFRPADDEGAIVHARLVARAVALGGARDRRRLPGDEALRALRGRLEALGGPDHLDERNALAGDLALLADAAGDDAAAVVAAHERAMAAALAGDDEAAHAGIRVIEEAAAKTDDPVAAALAAEHEAARAAMTGHFDDALVAVEAAARARGALDGPEAAAVVARRHRAIVGWMRSAPAPVGTGTDAPDVDGARCDAALELLVDGQADRARVLARDVVTGVSPLPAGDVWLHALGVLAIVAADLRDPALVDAVRAMLAPHADLTCGVGYLTFAGVAAFHLGRLAALSGEWADAERHLLVALRRYSALQARPWVAFTQHVRADVLEARGRPSDREWVTALRGESGWLTARLGLREL